VIWHSDRIGRATVSIVDDDLLTADPADVARQLGSESLVTVRQVHGADVAWVDDVTDATQADAIVVDRPGPAPLVRVADCVPLAIVDPDRALAGVVHAGRAGLLAGVVPATIDALRARGAERLVAVVGPRVCGGCYELSAELADDVARVVPEARATTTWGTPSADIGAGVVAQLEAAGVQVRDVGVGECTVEHDRWFSYRRQGAAAGRFGIAVVLS